MDIATEVKDGVDIATEVRARMDIATEVGASLKKIVKMHNLPLIFPRK